MDIDLRRVINVREGDRTVTLDSSRSAVGGLMTKMRSTMGNSSLDNVARPVIERVPGSPLRVASAHAREGRLPVTRTTTETSHPP